MKFLEIGCALTFGEDLEMTMTTRLDAMKRASR